MTQLPRQRYNAEVKRKKGEDILAQQFEIPGGDTQGQGSTNISDEILSLLQKNTKDPGEAFVLLQQLTIYVWDQFKIDWSKSKGSEVAPTRKQRYLEYAGALIDNLKANDMLVQKDD
jgi:hypothetical protein